MANVKTCEKHNFVNIYPKILLKMHDLSEKVSDNGNYKN